VLIAIDYAGTGDYEVRRVVSRATDTLTIDRACTTDPTTGRTVKVAPRTYVYTKSGLKTIHLWNFLSGDNFRHKMPGGIVKELEINYDASAKVPEVTHKFSGT